MISAKTGYLWDIVKYVEGIIVTINNMQPIYLVTSNISKYQEIKKALQKHDIKVKRINIDIPEIKSLNSEAVVTDKAFKAFKIVKKPVFVDDTGIFFKGYKDFPGMLSRFIFLTLGYTGIFKLIVNNHPAYFKSSVAYMDSNLKNPSVFTGFCHGKLIKKIKGARRQRMPYDNFFIPAGEKKTFAQLGIEGKQKHDHRSKAVNKLAKYLIQNKKS